MLNSESFLNPVMDAHDIDLEGRQITIPKGTPHLTPGKVSVWSQYKRRTRRTIPETWGIGYLISRPDEPMLFLCKTDHFINSHKYTAIPLHSVDLGFTDADVFGTLRSLCNGSTLPRTEDLIGITYLIRSESLRERALQYLHDTLMHREGRVQTRVGIRWYNHRCSSIASQPGLSILTEVHFSRHISLDPLPSAYTLGRFPRLTKFTHRLKKQEDINVLRAHKERADLDEWVPVILNNSDQQARRACWTRT